MPEDKFLHPRRGFLSGVMGGLTAAALPRAGQSETSVGTGELPTRMLGKTGVRVTSIRLGCFRLGFMMPDDAAVRLVEEACDAGINYFDTADVYMRSEKICGQALRGKRKEVFLATKTMNRARAGAEGQLAQSLHDLQTDYLDVWQIHRIQTQEEIERVFGPGGALEAFVRAKKEGKARFIGFTGVTDPEIHAAMLERYDFDTILMPLHAADPHYMSFEKGVLPRAVERNMGIIGMKVFADAMLLRAITSEDCLR
jgi:aryl-alcohol dehydrogenase-like predicted oxidoreductase